MCAVSSRRDCVIAPIPDPLQVLQLQKKQKARQQAELKRELGALHRAASLAALEDAAARAKHLDMEVPAELHPVREALEALKAAMEVKDEAKIEEALEGRPRSRRTTLSLSRALCSAACLPVSLQPGPRRLPRPLPPLRRALTWRLGCSCIGSCGGPGRTTSTTSGWRASSRCAACSRPVGCLAFDTWSWVPCPPLGLTPTPCCPLPALPAPSGQQPRT